MHGGKLESVCDRMLLRYVHVSRVPREEHAERCRRSWGCEVGEIGPAPMGRRSVDGIGTNNARRDDLPVRSKGRWVDADGEYLQVTADLLMPASRRLRKSPALGDEVPRARWRASGLGRALAIPESLIARHQGNATASKQSVRESSGAVYPAHGCGFQSMMSPQNSARLGADFGGLHVCSPVFD